MTNAPVVSDDVSIEDNSCTAYLDNFIAKPERPQDLRKDWYWKFYVLPKAGLHLKPEKCRLHGTEVLYLRLMPDYITEGSQEGGSHSSVGGVHWVPRVCAHF